MSVGYRIFPQNSYRKSPMSEIADAANISKSLLFHYFRNKQELYLFLWNHGAEITIEYLTKYGCYEPVGLFEMMERGMRAKLDIMKIYPDMAAFTIKAFYEKDPTVHDEIQKSYRRFFNMRAYSALARLYPNDFIPGLDLQTMYQHMYWTSVGYLWEAMQRGTADMKHFEEDFVKMLAFWKDIYLKKPDAENVEKEEE